MNTKRIMLGVVVVLMGVSSLRANITYYFVDYPAEQNGWTLTGFITTNGDVDEDFEASDILSWEWVAKKDGYPDSTASSGTGDLLWIGDGMIATAASLRLPPGRQDTYIGVSFDGHHENPELSYRNYDGDTYDDDPLYGPFGKKCPMG